MRQLTYDDRLFIADKLEQGYSKSFIARMLKRPFNTIWREIKRNAVNGFYDGKIANSVAKKRKKDTVKLLKFNSAIKVFIEQKMLKKWSFEEIAGYMALHNLPYRVSMKTMYRWHKIGILLDGKKIYLRKKGKCYKKASLFRWVRGKTIHERPKEVNKRQRLGDWEVDTVLSNRQSKKAILTAVDRKTRYIKACLVENKTADVVEKALVTMLGSECCYTITSDNGTEFANFERIEKQLNIDFYFAESFKSWQRGSNENANGLLREFFPKGSSFKYITDQDVQEAVNLINHRPCKLFNYKSRFEVYNE